MQPITVDNLSEQQCLANPIQQKWPINYNYWVSGTQEGSFGRFQWCTGQESSLPLDPNLQWAKSSPNYKAKGVRNCLQMRYVTLNSSLSLQMADKNCADKLVAACEVNPQI